MAGRIGYNGADKWKIKATELLNEGGGGGTDDYEDLENKPSINGVELSGNKTAAQLGINIPTKTSDLTNDSGFITKSADDLENYYKDTETDDLLDEKYDKISYVDISAYPYGGTGYYSGVITIDEDYQSGNTREYMSLWPNGIKLNFVYQDPDNPMVQRIVRDQLVSNFELWSLHGISKNIQDQIDALPTSDTTYTFSVGDANGEIKVTPSSGSAYNISVKGLGSAAYADTSDFQAPITGGATTIVSSNLTASRALVSNSSGKVAVSAVTSTELGYLSGVTSAIQTQLDGKVAKTNGLVCKTAASSSAGAVVVTHTETTGTSRYTMFAYGNGNGSPWFMEILYGSANDSSYVRCILSCNTSTKAGVRLISSTQFAIVCGSWDSVHVCENDDTFSVATASDTYTIDTSVTYQPVASDSYKLEGSSADTAATANTVVKRTADKYVYASFFNTSAGNQNPASYTSYPAFISSDGFLRRSTLANFQTFVAGSTAFTFTKSIGTINYQQCHSLLNKHINVINVRMTGLSGLVENKGAVQLGSIPSANAPSTTIYFPFAHTGSVGGEQYIYIGTDGKVYISMTNASGVSQVMFNIVYVK